MINSIADLNTKSATSILAELGAYIDDISIYAIAPLTDNDVRYRFLKGDATCLNIYLNQYGYYSIEDSVILRNYYDTPQDLALDQFTDTELAAAIKAISRRVLANFDQN